LKFTFITSNLVVKSWGDFGLLRNIYKFKGSFKGFLFILAVLLVLGFIYYTQILVSELQSQSREFLNFRIKLFERNINAEDVDDISFLFNEVIQTADYPIIYSNEVGEPQSCRNIKEIKTPLSFPISQDTLEILKKYMRRFDEKNNPIPISYQGKVLGFYHYGESDIIQRLRWLPYIEILVVALFILIGYSGFSSIKKSEERFIWVGMAKETAHQLGTPLSSLLGWMEILKKYPEQIQKIIPDLERDLGRLNKVTNRFSKIGSVPDFHEEQLKNIIEEIIEYFNNRMPEGKGKISFNTEINDKLPPIRVNVDLFSWVLENLIKNSLDSIRGKGGTISIKADFLKENQVHLDISDTGFGISPRNRKNIFKPGFSTKKRGWGLGLSLVKRIIQDYHGGNIFLKESQLGVGSTFRIVLNINDVVQ
jgi:hypothetical protein